MAAAIYRGSTAAGAKAFVADGHLSNWRMQQTYCSDYTPVLDLLHALSYMYRAAQAVKAETQNGKRKSRAKV